MPEETMELNDLLDVLLDAYQEKMPFHKMLGVKITELSIDNVCVRLDMKNDLVGNFQKNILHGGVISSLIDLTGGIIASVGVLKQMDGESLTAIAERFSKMGTIDMRVDYLRPGKGDYFLTTGTVLRTGKKVSVAQMQVHNDEGKLIASGTGSYMVG